jgi:hypothetical protein
MAVSARRAEKAEEANSSSAGSGFESEGAHHTRQERERQFPFSFCVLHAQRIEETLIRRSRDAQSAN